MNAALLARLRGAGGAFVPPAELGGSAADLDEIERFGFALERHPYLGVAYRGPSPRLCPDQIEWGWTPERIGRRIAVWDRVTSTNDLAASASRSRANDGLVILAEGQTAGRGRRGRSWMAPHGSCVLVSVLLFPDGPLADPSWLMALGAVAAAEVAEEFAGCRAEIKWPNDVRVERRKIAGVLVERGSGGAAVIGIGLNANVEEGEFPRELRGAASSLAALSGAPVDRSEVARSLIRKLDARLANGRRCGPADLAEAWRSRLEPLGREVAIRTGEGVVRGRLIAADLLRGLTLSSPDGAERTIAPGLVQEIDA